ncbi:MAG: UDP-3-O-(3-hydroxymyristoyl)glucosamine N-acyltransferase [Betaproteobacteria bacterium]|nr:UDP-3-O-(3-hydroxymyristoyl)glucosamine N-acyltransferase [Betaproteobacteria bacterium]
MMRLDEIVARFGGRLSGDGSRVVRQVATLERAGPEEISFLANLKYRSKLSDTRAGAVIMSEELARHSPVPCIACDHPYLYFARVAQCLNPVAIAQGGIHPAATVETDLPASVSVAAGAYIGPAVRIGERCRIGPGCVIGPGAEIGDDALLHANVTIYGGCRIGARAILHSGAVIGADGFGFAREPEGERAGAWVKIPQIGGVIIGDDVEVGANTTIDRGALDDTVIEDGVKFDNQIQVGHNVRIGAHSAFAGCVGIAGSASIGRRCTVGGGAIILGHLTIADDVNISAGTLIAKSIPKPGNYTGAVPFLEHGEWLKNFARLRQLDDLADRIRALEAQLKDLAASTAKPEETT